MPARSGMAERAMRVRIPIGWPSMVCVPAVTTCTSGAGRPARRCSSMNPAITERAALPVHNSTTSVMAPCEMLEEPDRMAGRLEWGSGLVDVDARDGAADHQPLDLRRSFEDGVYLRIAMPTLD